MSCGKGGEDLDQAGGGRRGRRKDFFNGLEKEIFRPA